jgi:peroxiredoxin
MQAWAESTGADKAGITVVADPEATLAKALKTEVTIPALGGVRSKRFAAYVDDGVIKYMVVDPGDESSFSKALLKVIAE